MQNQLSLVRGGLFGSVQTNVKFVSTTPQSHRRPAGNGLDMHVGAVIAFAAVAKFGDAAVLPAAPFSRIPSAF